MEGAVGRMRYLLNDSFPELKLWRYEGHKARNAELTTARDGSPVACDIEAAVGPYGDDVCYAFDGSTSYVNIYTANFSGAFNGAEGSFAIWAKVSAAGVWTDGASRNIMTLLADANNFARANKRVGADSVQFSRSGNATGNTVNLALSTTSWFHIALTWSEASGADGQLKAYHNGSQTGATQTALGTWAGALFTTATVIGAAITAPATVWSGYLAHAAIWTTPLTAAQILALATV